jgi:hypothetical protein
MEDRSKMKLIEMLALAKYKEELAELMEEVIENPLGVLIKLAKRHQTKQTGPDAVRCQHGNSVSFTCT